MLHSGAPGALIARMIVDDERRGYSHSSRLIDPSVAQTPTYHGSGFRLGDSPAGPLSPIVLVRNLGPDNVEVGAELRMSVDGSAHSLKTPPQLIGSEEVLNLGPIIENQLRDSGLQDIPLIAGIQISHDGRPEHVTVQVLSVTEDFNHSFEVPMIDTATQPSSAGGFPWTLSGSERTYLYFTNVTKSRPSAYLPAGLSGWGL